MNRQYKIVKTDGPRDEYEATFIPYEYAIKVKGHFRWHTVKKFQDFDKEYALRRTHEFLAKLEEPATPVDLPGDAEHRQQLREQIADTLANARQTYGAYMPPKPIDDCM